MVDRGGGGAGGRQTRAKRMNEGLLQTDDRTVISYIAPHPIRIASRPTNFPEIASNKGSKIITTMRSTSDASVEVAPIRVVTYLLTVVVRSSGSSIVRPFEFVSSTKLRASCFR